MKTEILVIKSQLMAVSNDTQTSDIEEKNNEKQQMEVENNESSDDSNDVINYVRK